MNPLYLGLPDGAEAQQKAVHALRDSLIDGSELVLDQVGTAIYFARAVCMRATRPIRSDVVAAALRSAAAFHRAICAPRPTRPEVAHEKSQLARLGWKGIGGVRTDEFFEQYAEAVTSRAPYTSTELAAAALTFCLEGVCVSSHFRDEIAAPLPSLNSELRLILAMALTAFPEPAPDRDFGIFAPPLNKSSKTVAYSGAVEVEASFSEKDFVAVKVHSQRPIALNIPGFEMLCSLLLSGGAATTVGVGAMTMSWSRRAVGEHKLQIASQDWTISSKTLTDLQRSVTAIQNDAAYTTRIRHLELTRGTM